KVPAPVDAVPASLHASLMARLDRLGPAKEVAQIGAVIGREFSYELLSAASDQNEVELRLSLQHLVDAGLVFQRGTPPDAMYLFKHALVQDTAYGTLLRNRRQDFHRRIARILKEQFPERAELEPGLLAHHFAEARQAEPAVAYFLMAGRQAADRSSYKEAVLGLRRGLGFVGGLAPSPERDQQELELQLALGSCLAAIHGYSSGEVGAVYDRTNELCEAL